MRTLTLSLLIVVVALTASAASAQDGASRDTVDVIEVSGLLDPVLVDFVEDSIAAAADDRSVALVLQLDSPGAVVGRPRLARLLQAVEQSDVPVVVWVGPSGAQARDEAAELVAAADVRAVAPSSRLEPPDDRSYGSDEAVEERLSDLGGLRAATVGDVIVNLPDFGIDVEVREIREGDEIRREPLTRTRFAQLPLLSQLAHAVASPAVAYLLFVIGMALLLFELYTAGVGVAGVVGAGSLLLGAYGLGVLPTNPVGIGLLLLAMFGFAVDVQTGVPRTWTVIGAVAYVAGSLVLYGEGITLSWITLLVSVVGMVLAMVTGMPTMVRTRFSTPTIGREWMLEEEGVARTSVDPEGTVVVRDAPWRARTNRATPIAAGDRVRVAAIDGLVLEVEPLDGAARDYRERGSERASERDSHSP
ncbi:MAG: NfeD family protein [Acidimicrobiales bacterium]